MRNQIRKSKVPLAFLLCGLMLGAIAVTVYVRAVTPSIPNWIMGGVYSGAPSFTVWRDGDNYFAKNEYGYISYSGTNASQIINNALLNGGTVFLCDGTYEITASILLQSKSKLVGETRTGTILQLENDLTAMVQFVNSNVELTEISHLTLYGNNGTYHASGILFNNIGLGYNVSYIDPMHKIFDVFIYKFSGNGIDLEGDCRETQLLNVYVYGCEEYGFYLMSGDHKINNCVAGQNGYSGFALVFGCDSIINCKAFGNGWRSGGETFRDGFVFAGIVGWHVGSNLYSQDNYRCGFLIYNTTHIELSNLISDHDGVETSLDSAGLQLDMSKNCSIINIEVGLRMTGGFTYGDLTNDFGIREMGTSDYNIITNAFCRDALSWGILKIGSHTYVSHSWNKTTWIP